MPTSSENDAIAPATSHAAVSIRRLPIDVEVGDDRVVVRAALAGFTAEEIDVRATDRDVVILASHRGKSSPSERAVGELYHGAWRRHKRLPVAVCPDQAQVTFQNGILTIDVPRATEPQHGLADLPGGETLNQPEIPLRTSADVMPPGPGPHFGVNRP
jgi:HSP20 family protein